MTVVTNWRRVQGDSGDSITAEVGGVVDLFAISSVVGKVKKYNSGVAAVDLDADVLDATARTVVVQLSPWLETADPGTWWFELELRGAGLDPLTWPEGLPAIIYVRPQVG